jgi:hypothetical protein
MSVLKFPADLVRKLADHAAAAKDHRPAYGQPKVPGLMLVGDQGVYLMSTGLPRLPRAGSEKGSFVVYADGINPDVDEFDSWWERKRATFGGDDGADVIPLESFQRALASPIKGKIEIEITSKTLGVLIPIPQKLAAGCPRCGALGSSPCVTPSGKKTKRHKGRGA